MDLAKALVYLNDRSLVTWSCLAIKLSLHLFITMSKWSGKSDKSVILSLRMWSPGAVSVILAQTFLYRVYGSSFTFITRKGNSSQLILQIDFARSTSTPFFLTLGQVLSKIMVVP